MVVLVKEKDGDTATVNLDRVFSIKFTKTEDGSPLVIFKSDCDNRVEAVELLSSICESHRQIAHYLDPK